jgi:hypothetical protein
MPRLIDFASTSQALRVRLPLLSAWFGGIALFSLGPLLAKDGLLAAPLPLAFVLALAAAHLALGLGLGGAEPTGRRADGAHEAAALGFALRLAVGPARAPTDAHLQRFLRRGALATAALGAALAASAACVVPPQRLPDLHAYANAAACAALFFVALVLGSVVQLYWVFLE